MTTNGVDIGSIVGIGGPVGGIALIVGYLVNAYLAKRKDDREDKKLGVESESGIVETTGKALEIVRSQMDRMEQDHVKLRTENDALRERVRHLEQQNSKLEHRINWLEVDNKDLKEEIAVLRGEASHGI